MSTPAFQRSLVSTIASRMQEPRRFIQIVVGPRQTGKTTAIRQVMEQVAVKTHYFSFDDQSSANADNLREHWHAARQNLKETGEALLILDEVQRIKMWSSTVKSLWDEDTRLNANLKVVLSGSSPLLLRKGLTESLAGRFEIIYSPHWSLWECKQAFDYSLDDYLYFGGYPGAAQLRDDDIRWRAYLRQSIIEPTLTKDVLLMDEVRKPAVLEELFYIGTAYSAQELSYRKLLGQLQDAGNTNTIANYLGLLKNAGILTGLFKYDDKIITTRSSSPRMLSFDPALLTLASGRSRYELLSDSATRGHVIESAIGSYLLARGQEDGFELFWWREGKYEVDFVIKKGLKRTAIEVKSGRAKSLHGMRSFLQEYPGTYALVVGGSDVSIEDFLLGKCPLFQ